MPKKIYWLTFLLLMIVVGSVKGYKYLPTTSTQDLSTEQSSSTRPITELTVDRIKVYKSKRYLELIQQNQVVRRYPIRLGFDPLGHKTTEGDGKTPEGTYTIDWRNPSSAFYKSLHVSYPNQQDIAQATQRGVSAGSNIMIHGSTPKLLNSKISNSNEQNKLLYHYMPHQDWTLGCIAVSNAVMDELWVLIKDGTTIEIVP